MTFSVSILLCAKLSPQTEAWRLVLPGLAEDDIWPALLSQVEVYTCRSNVDQTATVIQREVVVRLALKITEHLRITAFHPARGRDVNGFEQAFDLVFVAQPVCDDVELQRPDGAENQII